MKILLVHNFYQQAGGEDQVFAEEAALLQQNGHTVAKFTMDNDSIEGMGKLTLAKKTIWNKDAQQSLRQAIREIGAEVVHFHNTFPLVSPAAYYTTHEEGAAVVQTLHNYRLLCPAATFFREGGVCEKCLGKSIPWPGVLHKCYRDNRGASAVVAGMLSYHRFKGTWQNEVDRYIALTKFAKEKFVEGGLPGEKILIKPNFVSPDPGIGDGSSSYALFVGRLTEEKGVKLLLKSWNPLFKRTSLELKIVGDGPLREVVQAASYEGSGIKFLGRLPAPEVYEMMGQARMLIFPSQWFEGQPRTIVESFAKGTPVIATRLGSMTEMIEPGSNGLLFAAGDADDLTRQVESLSNDSSGLLQMRKMARREFEAHYTAERNHELMLDCYRQALGAR